MNRQLTDRGQRQHFVGRPQLYLERPAVGEERRVGVAVDHAGHDH